MSTKPSSLETLHQSRGWLIGGGILSVIVGLMAISEPLIFTGIIVIFIGAMLLVSGLISLGLALFESHQAHRLLNGIFAIVRIAAGAVILMYVPSGVFALTLILAVFFIIEGISSIGFAFKMRAHSGWVWILLNGLVALVLGGLIWNKLPSDAEWVIGLLYGINSLFFGFSLLMLGLGTRKPDTPAP